MTERVTGRGNPLMKHIRALGRSADARRLSGEFAADGMTLLDEAVKAGIPVNCIVTRDGQPVPILPGGTRRIAVPDPLMDWLSPMQTPPGVMFTAAAPDLSLPGKPLPPGRYIILDRLQDPGNIGTIIRSARAFGADAVLMCDGCADPYNPKAVRASMGALFHVRVFRGTDAAIRDALGQVPVYAAVPEAGAVNLSVAALNPSAVVIGQEGSGVSGFWRSQGQALAIPMAPGCESLNAAMAAAVILWEGYCRGSFRRSADT